MSYKLRFVQRFQLEHTVEFMTLEEKFARLEREDEEFPNGKRYTPVSGRDPENTLIWECEFDTLEEAQKTLEFLQTNTKHEDLFQIQSRFFLEAHTEIYKSLDF